MKKHNIYLLMAIFALIICVTNISGMVFASPEKETQTAEEIERAQVDVSTLEEFAYTEFLKDVDQDKVKYIYYNETSPFFCVETEEFEFYTVTNPEYETFKKDMLEKGIEVKAATEVGTNFNKEKSNNSFSFLQLFIFMSTFMIFCSCMMRWFITKKTLDSRKEQVIVKETNVQTPKTEKRDISVKKFKDIAGHKEVKKDMQSLVDFLKNKDKYTEAGATLPKGVIFYGPPGTGKTLLAKAIAGEAGIPFYYMSGSDFIEMYVGMGAKRVRELFEKAKKNAPCIIFIDEIDAIGGRRSGNDSNGEDRKTINALLTEMDGFQSTDNILVIAATNRLEDLDPALTRPGRFTNKFCVPLPETAKERLEIIRLYAKNKKFADNVDFEALSKETMGFSPAAIEALLNEAAIVSVQDNKRFIDKETIDKAMFKILLSGHVKENQAERDMEELKLVAWHEAGHALVGLLNGKDIPKVTILSSTSGAGGVTFTTPRKSGLYSVEDLKSEVRELYAGRVAEFMLLQDKNKVTTGASNDIERATHIIKEIISNYGMTEHFGLLNLNQLQVSQNVIIEKEVELSKELEQETQDTLTQKYGLLKKIAESLLEKETLYQADLEEILKNA